MTTKAILLAGGLGTRLRPLTETVPKCLIPVAGRPMLDYWVDALDHAGIAEALINTHHLVDPVRDYIADVNARGGVTLTETYEPELLGSAGTITANRAFADGADDLVIIYADNLSTVDLGQLVDVHRSHSDPMTMLLFRAPVPKACGIATLDADDRVTDFTEKPEHPQSDLANAGIYAVTAEAWREIADMGAFDLGFDVLPRFVGRMRGMRHEGYHLDIGTPEALAKADADAERLFG